jgi:hypothetical protein
VKKKKWKKDPERRIENLVCCFFSCVADKVVWMDKAQERGLWEQEGLPNVYTFPRVICIVHREIISTQSSIAQIKPGPDGFYTSLVELFIKPHLFPLRK